MDPQEEIKRQNAKCIRKSDLGSVVEDYGVEWHSEKGTVEGGAREDGRSIGVCKSSGDSGCAM